MKAVDKLTDYYNNNKEKWMKELVDQWKNNKWTDCCLDEYCSYKMWVYTQGEEYFELMQQFMLEKGESIPIEELKHDSWKLYLTDMGMLREPWGKEFANKIGKKLNNTTNEEEDKWLKN